MIKAIIKYLHVSKPDYLYHHNGNYDWTFKRFGPIYVLIKLEYNEDPK